MKMCTGCSKEKPFSEFHKNSKRKDGLQVECKNCKKSRDAGSYQKNRTAILDKRRENVEKITSSRYGITEKDLAKLKAKFNGKCWICKENPGEHVDHCHNTNKVRGWLCRTCNLGLGMFKDNPKKMKLAMEYLSRVV